jgi:hypothetical protein
LTFKEEQLTKSDTAKIKKKLLSSVFICFY